MSTQLNSRGSYMEAAKIPGHRPSGLAAPAPAMGVTRPSQAEAMPEPPGLRVRSPMPSDSALGRKVRELRRSRGMTQKELAGAVGVTGAQLHRYETGATRVAASRMIAIAEALGVRPDVLLGSASPEVVPALPSETSTGNDLLELIQLFSAIGDPKNRNAVLAIARMMASPNQGGGSGS